MTSHAMTTKTERKWEFVSPASSSHDIVIYMRFFFAEVRHVWPTQFTAQWRRRAWRQRWKRRRSRGTECSGFICPRKQQQQLSLYFIFNLQVFFIFCQFGTYNPDRALHNDVSVHDVVTSEPNSEEEEQHLLEWEKSVITLKAATTKNI